MISNDRTMLVFFPPQLFSEKISGAEGTKLDDEFLDMERVRAFSYVNGIRN